MREILFECIAFLNYAVLGLVLAWYCGGFSKARFQAYPGGKYYIVPVWVLIRELAGNLWNTEFQPVMTIIKQLVLAVILYLMIWCFYQTYWQMRLYLCATYIAISELSLFLILAFTPFQSYVFQFGADMMDRGRWNYEETMAFIETAAVVMQVFTNLFYMVLFTVLIRVVANQFHYKRIRLDTRDVLYLISPAFTGWILGLLLRSILYTLEDGVPHLVYDRYPVLHVFVPLMWITILGGIVLTILFYQDMTKRREKEFGMRMLEQQVEGLQSQLQEVERINEAGRAMRHDMKNLLSVVLNLSTDADNGQLRRYLADAGQSIREIDFKFRTGDSAVDSLLNMKYYAAVERIPGILFDADLFWLPEGSGIRSFDLCLILGNALDNAIEACEKLYSETSKYREEGEPNCFIMLSSKRKEETLLIEVRNSFNGDLRMGFGEEYPESMKEDPEKHGIGMRNMKRVAEKYFGEVTFCSEDGVFTLWITLQNN